MESLRADAGWIITKGRTIRATKTLADIEREVRVFAPSLFSMKTRSGPVRKHLGRLFEHIQTIHNSKAIADTNLEETREYVEKMVEENRVLREMLTEVGLALPDNLTGSVSISIDEETAVRLARLARGLILERGEEDLEDHGMFDFSEVGGPRIDQSDETAVGAFVRAYLSKHQNVSMGVAQAAAQLTPVTGKKTELQQLRDAVVDELDKQGFVADNLEVKASPDECTIYIRTTGLTPTGKPANSIFDRNSLRKLIQGRVPAAVRVVSPLL